MKNESNVALGVIFQENYLIVYDKLYFTLSFRENITDMVIKKKNLSASSVFSFCIQICPLQAPMIIIFVNFLFLVFFFLIIIIFSVVFWSRSARYLFGWALL